MASASPEPTARIAGRSPLSRRSALLLGGLGVAGTAVGGAGLWWSLAAGVLAFAGIVLSPAAGAVLMSASRIVVALNAQLLRAG